MTAPRRIVPGRTYLITRRTEGRRFLFRPDSVMNQIFLYLLALYVARFGLLLHAAILMSTHFHIVVTDPNGRLPEFLMHFNRMMVLATRAYRHIDHAVWDKRRPSVVELLTPDAILQKMAYTIGNPVADGLVRTPADWPGTVLRPDDARVCQLMVKRPDEFFHKLWPASVDLRVGWPPALLESSTDSALEPVLRQELGLIEQTASEETARTKRSVMGARRILTCSPSQCSTTPEVRGERSPTFAVGRGRRDEYRDALAALRQFRAAYRHARERWRIGDRSKSFPPGTWWMVRFHNAIPDPTSAAHAA